MSNFLSLVQGVEALEEQVGVLEKTIPVIRVERIPDMNFKVLEGISIVFNFERTSADRALVSKHRNMIAEALAIKINQIMPVLVDRLATDMKTILEGKKLELANYISSVAAPTPAPAKAAPAANEDAAGPTPRVRRRPAKKPTRSKPRSKK